MKRRPFVKLQRLLCLGLITGVGAFIISPSALLAADGQLSDKALTKKECSACHYYYSAHFLPAYSWKAIIGSLTDHFGEDASLDEVSTKRILSHLAGDRATDTPRHVTKIPIHVTDTDWWNRAHGARFIDAATRDHIKLSNCKNCHGLWKLSPVGNVNER